ncbi:unnamed protein product, partial [marine sediment metagenome]
DCTGECLAVVTEGSDRTGSDVVASVNRNRVGTPNTSGVVVNSTVASGSTDGTVTLINHRSGATGQASKTVATGGARGTNEFPLKPNTKYIISVTTYADVWVSVNLNWYDHISN